MNINSKKILESLAAKDLVVDKTIDDVLTTFLEIVKTKYKKQLRIAVVAFVICFIFGIYILLRFKIPGEFITLFVFIPIFVVAIVANNIFDQVRKSFYRQFATANNYYYQDTGWHQDVTGAVFQIGFNKKMSEIITGKFLNYELCLFNYHYEIRGNKKNIHYNKTVFELELNSPVPSMVLTVDQQFFESHVLLSGFGKSLHDYKPKAVKVTLPDKAESHYTLFVRKDFEIEALQIFTPEFLELLQEKFKNYTLDFAGNKMYIYASHVITNKQELYQMYQLAQYIISKLVPVISRMKGGLVELDKAFSKYE